MYEYEVGKVESKESIDKIHLGKTKVVNRVEYILKACKDEKSILHLGCVDSPFVEDRIVKGQLLHQRICAIAPNVAGVDLDSKGIQIMQDRLGIKNLYEGNIEELDTLDLGSKYSLVLAPEIVEHINNPGLFFGAVSKVMERNGVLLITVPNALFIKSFVHAMLRREKVHPDHNFYFSPVTLRRLIESNGFSVLEMFPYWSDPRRGVLGILDRVFGSFKHLSAWLGDGLVVCARPEIR